MRKATLLGLVAGVGLSFAAVAQERSTTATSNPSARPIPESDIMFKKVVWRAIDLREKKNLPMFSQNREITKVIIDAVKRGELQAYKNDSLATPLTLEEFNKNLTMPDEAGGLTEAEKAAGLTEQVDDGWGTPVKKTAPANTNVTPAGSPTVPPVAANEYFPKQIHQLELKEEVVFDKKRSRMYHDIKSITLMLPASLSAIGIEQEIGSFKYSDLVKVFRNNPDQAIWFNTLNDAQHKNLADAFELWLFGSYIVKVSNPADARLEDIYGGPKQGLLAAQQVAEELIEFEYNLWSF
jgi:gliding motility associated protien GldN